MLYPCHVPVDLTDKACTPATRPLLAKAASTVFFSASRLMSSRKRHTLSSVRKLCWSIVQPGTTTSLMRHPMCSFSVSESADLSSRRSSSGISLAFHQPPGTNSCITSPLLRSDPMTTLRTVGPFAVPVGGAMRVYRARPAWCMWNV